MGPGAVAESFGTRPDATAVAKSIEAKTGVKVVAQIDEASKSVVVKRVLIG
jgi:hypothetical protein